MSRQTSRTDLIIFATIVCVLGAAAAAAATPSLDVAGATPFSPGRRRRGWFGYALSFRRNRAGVHSLLVGAPRANTTQLEFGVVEPGALYECALPLSGSPPSERACVQLPVDVAANDVADERYDYRATEEKSGQMLGASVTSFGDGGQILTCAPLYVYKGPSGHRSEPLGACYVSDGESAREPNFRQLQFCRERRRQMALDVGGASDDRGARPHSRHPAIQTTGSGMCGFSVASTSDVAQGGYLFAVGAPGSFYWLGQLYAKTSAAQDAFSGDQSIGPSRGEDYLGYAVAVGRFSRDPTVSHIVSSAPKANATRGQLFVFSSTFLGQMLTFVSGDQPGSYLGYAVAVADVDGNGVHDIVAGAPMWTDYDADKAEAGAIYVYRWLRESRPPRPTPEFQPCPVVRGQTALGRLGSAVVAAGDLNLDGAADVAVGAPYGGPDGRGAVYIYRGTPGGCLREPYAQVIFASDVTGPRPQTFGWSLAGGVDVDGNGYADLAIGAYKSDSAYLLRTRPVISTTTSVSTQPAAISLGNDCDDGDEGSALAGVSAAASSTSTAAAAVAEFIVRVCIAFRPAGGLAEPSRAAFRATVVLDVDQPLVRRAFFRPSGLATASLELSSPGPSQCGELPAYVPRGARDKVSPIAIAVSHELLNTSLAAGSGVLDAVVDGYQTNGSQTSLAIKKNCSGSDGSCRPRLSLAARSGASYYVAGVDESMVLIVTVSNAGEDAYNASVVVELPDGISYVNAQSSTVCPLIACHQEPAGAAAVGGGSEPTRVSCDVGNPLPSGRDATFTLRTRLGDASRLRSPDLAYVITATSTFGNRTTRLSSTTRVELRAEAAVYITGTSLPDADVTYNDTLVGAGGRGPAVSHRYEVFTEGPSDIDEAELVILWPASLRNGTDHLLHLLKPPAVVSGNGSCSVRPTVQLSGTAASPGGTSGGGAPVVGSSIAGVARDSYTCGEANDNEAGEVTCTVIVCRLFSLSRSAAPSIVLVDSALWLGPTFARLTSGHSRRASVYSVANATVVGYPLGMRKAGGSSSQQPQLLRVGSYFDKYRPPMVAQSLDWKWIVIGAVGGLLLLVVIILIFWRCGFFKRNRPPTVRGVIEKEKVPLSCETDEGTSAAVVPT